MNPVHQAYLDHQDALKRFLRRFYRRGEDIEDAAQETFLRAFKASLDREIDDPKAFLFRVARNYAIDEKRLTANKATDYLADSEVQSVLEDKNQPRADDAMAAKQKLALLAHAVSELPPQCRRVFIMRKFERRPIRDIAEALGVSVSSIDKHIATGLIKCRQYLAAHGYEMEGGGPKGAGEAARPEAAKKHRTTT